MGPVIDKQSQERIEGFIKSGHKDGATCIFPSSPLPTAQSPLPYSSP
jgi:acyl-CoA reductase-like NAD-dependent aldehyde dehydrogenase